MFSTKPEVVIFNELIATQKSYIRDLSLVDASWLLKDQPEYFRLHRGHIFALEDSWFDLKCILWIIEDYYECGARLAGV